MSRADVLVITALKEEYEAAKRVAEAAGGIKEWTVVDRFDRPAHLIGEYRYGDGKHLTIALARASRTGGRSTGPLATQLATELAPICLAMCGVCAGNPSEVALGDVVVAETVYQYDEGKLTADGFRADVRQYPLPGTWVRAAQDFDTTALPSYGPPTGKESVVWFLERLRRGQDPRTHPARTRCFPAGSWPPPQLDELTANGLVTRTTPGWKLTTAGRTYIERVLYDDAEGPQLLPFQVVVGPMASGNLVAADGRSWADLAGRGVRSVVALEMEAATIATVADSAIIPHWLVVKGAMDHADPQKDDRYKTFAAHASAEVLFALVEKLVRPAHRTEPQPPNLCMPESTSALARVPSVGASTSSSSPGRPPCSSSLVTTR